MIRTWQLNRRRRAAASLARDPTMAEALAADLPSHRADYRSVNYLAVDLETTGLDPLEADMISLAWVPVRNNRVMPGLSRQLLIAQGQPMNQTATIHGLTDTDLKTGHDLATALREFVRDLRGQPLIVHSAPLDITLLSRLCKACFGAPLPVPVIDTLELEKQRLTRLGTPIKADSLRLAACRQRYQLPQVPLHDALGDAIATAELFLAIASHKAGNGQLPLQNLLSRSV